MRPASNAASCFSSGARLSGKREKATAEREVKGGLFLLKDQENVGLLNADRDIELRERGRRYRSHEDVV